MKNSNHRGMRAHHRAHDPSLGAPIRTHVDDVDQYEVPVHGIANGVWSDEDISGQPRLERRTQRLCIRNDEAEAVAVHGEPARDQILVGTRGYGRA